MFPFFSLCLGVQCVYWLRLRQGFTRAQAAPPPLPSDRPISVVVAARNEAERLQPLVAALDAQTHPDFEVVLVDDGSTDATAEVVRGWAARNPRVRLVSNDGPPGKKGALATGIRAARHDALALTDADCAPPPGWLRCLAAYHEAPGETLVILYAPYRARPGLLNRFARYETLVTGFLTAAAVGLGRPYMAVGRGIGYTRTLFEQIEGFETHAQLLSGDDDLLVQAVARTGAARVVHTFGLDTYVPSDAPTTWRQWLRQKRRHLSDGRHYDRDLQLHLGLFHTTSLLLWLAPVFSGWPGLGLLAVRLGVTAYALAPAARAFGEQDLLPRAPLLEGLYALYNGLLAPLSMAGTLRRW